MKEKAEILHINNGGYPGALSCRVAALAGRCAGKRQVILVIHNMAKKAKGVLDLLIDHFVRKSISFVVAVSDASGLTLYSLGMFEADNIVTIYNGIKAAVPAEPVPVGRRISMVGRFEKRKGHAVVVRAFKKMVQEHPELADIEILFMGEGPLLTKIRKLVLQEGMEKNLVFAGHSDNCAGYVAGSLFLLNPSIEYESLPYSIMEAMSIGVPSIGTDVGGISEEIENNVTGIVVPPDDADALAEAMFALISDDNRRIAMGIAAKKRFDNLFTLNNMIDNYLALYDKVAS